MFYHCEYASSISTVLLLVYIRNQCDKNNRLVGKSFEDSQKFPILCKESGLSKGESKTKRNTAQSDLGGYI